MEGKLKERDGKEIKGKRWEGWDGKLKEIKGKRWEGMGWEIEGN